MREGRLDFAAPLLWTIDRVLDEAECRALVARTEAIGYGAAPVTTAAGPVHMPEVRNNERVTLLDAGLADLLLARVAAQLPGSLRAGQAGEIWRVAGANELLRCYRYGPGQRFAAHHDGAYVRHAGERSFVTLMVYLNDDFDGGETRFLDLQRTVVPRTGTALLFQHALLHEGAEVERGIKYVVRTDVMYQRADEQPAQAIA